MEYHFELRNNRRFAMPVAGAAKGDGMKIDGIVPVMLTPMTEADALDFDGLARLTDWYLDHGSSALFAVCQSSEMQHLSVAERVALSRAVVAQAGGRVPVLASGHVAAGPDDQARELVAIAETGVDVLVLVTNRLDPDNAGTAAFRANLDALLARLPSDLPLGLYECPAPYRRLLSDEELALCRDTGRFVVLKDVSCDVDAVARRVALCAGSPLRIVNANAAIARAAMRKGSAGFAGVFTNFHPDLYAWLHANRDRDDALADDLTVFLALAANAEPLGYPRLAKIFHQRLGTFASDHSRVVGADLRARFWALDDILAHIEAGTAAFRARLSAAG